MEKIRFRSKDENEQIFARALRERVLLYFKENNLSTKGNFTLYLKSLIMLSIYLIPFVVLLTTPMGPWTALLMTVLMGVGEAGIGMSVMHDGVHGAFSNRSWLNKLAGSTMFLLGSNTFNWKVQHNIKHHTFTNIYQYDTDISTKAVIRLCEHAPLKKYHRYQHIYAFPLYGLMTLLRFFGEIPKLLQLNREKITEGQNANPALEMIKLIVTKVAYTGMLIGLPLGLTDFSIWQILIGFATMHIVAGMIMSTVFQMAHVVEGAMQPLPDENHVIHTEWMVHQLHTTSDFGRKNGLFSWYIGGLDYQIEHHLFQNISHVHYHAIAPIVEATAKEYGITYNLKPSVYKAFASHYRRLKELGREKRTFTDQDDYY
jgi:linoleoyl-CoA desaturase